MFFWHWRRKERRIVTEFNAGIIGTHKAWASAESLCGNLMFMLVLKVKKAGEKFLDPVSGAAEIFSCFLFCVNYAI